METDNGYGLIGNMSKIILIDMMDEEEEMEYRKKLKSEDKKKYDEFIEFEEKLKKQE